MTTLLRTVLILTQLILLLSTARAADEKDKYSVYEREASSLSSEEIFSRLRTLDQLRSLKPVDPKDPWAFLQDEDTIKSIGYSSTLAKRKNAGDPVAAFYFATYKWDECALWKAASKGRPSPALEQCWADVLSGYRIASSAQIPNATFNIGRLYEGGHGVIASKLVAAEWYIKAADQYNRVGDRDNALTSVEAALNIAPDLPAALRLRKNMLR